MTNIQELNTKELHIIAEMTQYSLGYVRLVLVSEARENMIITTCADRYLESKAKISEEMKLLREAGKAKKTFQRTA